MRKYLIMSVFLISCWNKDGTAFSDFVGQLEKINTPVSFRTLEFEPPQTDRKYSEALFEKYKHDDASDVVGTIFNEEKFVGIVYIVPGDVATPVLVTYDKTGNKIDSFNLFENASGFGVESETYETVTMLPDKRIQVIDSTMTWPVDSSGEERTSEIAALKVEKLLHRINEDGKIIKNVKK